MLQGEVGKTNPGVVSKNNSAHAFDFLLRRHTRTSWRFNLSESSMPTSGEHAGGTDGGLDEPLPSVVTVSRDSHTVSADQVATLVGLTDGVENPLGQRQPPAAVEDTSTVPTAVKRQSRVGSRIGSKLRRESIAAFVTAEVDSFFDIFGRLGIAMVIVFLFSALWTFMLAFIQVYTNDMANAIMNTASFDNGQFWMLPEPDPAVVWVSVVLLVLFGIGYLGLVFYMLFFRRFSLIVHSTAITDSQMPTTKCKRVFESLKRHFTNPTPIERHYFVRVLRYRMGAGMGRLVRRFAHLLYL